MPKIWFDIDFWLRHTWFGIREEWSDLYVSLFGLVMYPVYVLILTLMWSSFRGTHGNLSLDELLLYIGLAEIIAMTTLSGVNIQQASADFSLNFTRPRSWYTIFSSLFFGRTFMKRLIYLAFYTIFFICFTDSIYAVSSSAVRFLTLLPFLTVIEVLYSLVWATLYFISGHMSYFRFAMLKVIMVFGGVIAPLSEASTKSRPFFLASPFADIIFQPAYYAIRGEFFELSPYAWLIKIGIQAIALFLLALLVYRYARHRQHVYGG